MSESITRKDIALAIVTAGLTYSIEDDPIYMREKTLNEVVDAVMNVINNTYELR